MFGKKGKKPSFLTVLFFAISLLGIAVGAYLNSRKLDIGDSYAALPKEDQVTTKVKADKSAKDKVVTTTKKAPKADKSDKDEVKDKPVKPVTKTNNVPVPVTSKDYCPGSCAADEYQESGLDGCKPVFSVSTTPVRWVPNCKKLSTIRFEGKKTCTTETVYKDKTTGSAIPYENIICKADGTNVESADADYKFKVETGFTLKDGQFIAAPYVGIRCPAAIRNSSGELVRTESGVCYFK